MIFHDRGNPVGNHLTEPMCEYLYCQ